MKKIILAVAGLAVTFAIYFYLGKRWSDDEGAPIGLAFGKQVDGLVPMHVVVAMGTTRRDGPRLEFGVLNWDKWIDEHFDLRDPAGQKLPLRKMNFSSLITEQQAMTPEFFLEGKLKPGSTYTFDYIPVVSEKTRYRHKFVAPPSGGACAHEFFKLVGP